MSDDAVCVEATTVGVQGDDGKVVACPVRLQNSIPWATDTVGVFTFDQFTSLSERMEQVKPHIETEDSSDDEDEIYSLSDRTLMELHDLFIPIVRQVVLEHHFYASGLQDYNLEGMQIKKYAKPNYRKATDQYAQYLHNDAWLADDTNNGEGETLPAVAMVNVWFILNKQPPSNTLVFWQTDDIDAVRATHMLHAHPVHVRHQIVVCHGNMTWGRFYVFVAGQRQDTTAKLLLHGALSVPPNDGGAVVVADGKDDTGAIRRSVEMRYMLHAPKR